MDLKETLQSIVMVRTSIPDDGFTAVSLGTDRSGSGVVIRESGLVLTIGYLVTEAREIWLTSADGRVTAGHALAYDQESGFGLVQALGPLDLPALALGHAAGARLGDGVVLAAAGEAEPTRSVIVTKQEFAGYWEYLIDDAIFTAPANPMWGGAGLIAEDGRLLGIGSLLVQRVGEGGRTQDINMSVPIDLLPPILDDLLAYGQVNKPARPWLGLYSAEREDRIVVADLASKGPAARAGLKRGDIITAVRDLDVESLADFYRKVWACGPAGTEIALDIVRAGRNLPLRIKSADRQSFLKRPSMH